MKAINSSVQANGLRVVAHAGDNKVLLAMSIDLAQAGREAGNRPGKPDQLRRGRDQ